MRLILLADAFPPLRSSAAIQLLDLARELCQQGHKVFVVIASPEISTPWRLETMHGFQILRIKTLQAKGRHRFIRALTESLMPLVMWWNWRKAPWASSGWDGLIWYSPTIFLGPIVYLLKRSRSLPCYLILRDIFPQWAVDMQLMRHGLAHQYFKAVAQFQYRQADVIGVQSPGNLSFFQNRSEQQPLSVEVLHNWLARRPLVDCQIQITKTPLAGRKIVVYTGNMGIAQDVDILLELAALMKDVASVGFLLVGRGTEVHRLKKRINDEKMCNVLLYDEIDPEEIPALYAQCHVGMLTLDRRHLTHNIPGKFVSYMSCGLPVLASVNENNDLVSLIRHHNVGKVSTEFSASSLYLHLTEMLSMDTNREFRDRCLQLHSNLFFVQNAARQICQALKNQPSYSSKSEE